MKTALIALIIPLQLWAENFGSNGSNGYDGTNGYDGQSGQSITVNATGQNELLNLWGENGTDGRNGEPGQTALGCVQPMNVSYNLSGASGGRGGDGGRGGAGGNGGSMIVYYTDIAHLKRISVRSTPGRSGIGGYGAYGGQGCYCTMPQWTVTQGTATNTYTCHNGSNGYNGTRGSNGSTGSRGSITLINSPGNLAPEAKEIRIPMEQLLSQPYTLLKHLWESKTGARQLFANGSDITDAYTFYAGAVRKTVEFAWADPRPITDFPGKAIYISLNNSTVSFTPSDWVWASGTLTEVSPEILKYTLDHVLTYKEATNLSVGSIVGVDNQAELRIEDASKVSGFVSSDVQLRYYTLNGNAYYQRWSGKVPAEAIVTADDVVKIQLGKLGVKADYLKSGLKALVEVWVTRKLGGKSDQLYYKKFTALQ